MEKLYGNFELISIKISNNFNEVAGEIKLFEKKFNSFAETNEIKKYLIKSKKLLKKNFDKKEEALKIFKKAELLFINQINWRKKGRDSLLNLFINLEEISKDNFGLRKQEKLNKEQAIFIASYKAEHIDISLNF